jgi:hypothetical protein
MRQGVGRASAIIFAASIAASGLHTSAIASTPSLLWANLRQVTINCLVQSRSGLDAAALEAELCARVGTLARKHAPVPVKLVEAGDRAMLSAGTVTLLVHASVERTGRASIAAFTIRPYRASDPDSHILFGSSPRAVQLPRQPSASSLDKALSDALAEILPWRAEPPQFMRPL